LSEVLDQQGAVPAPLSPGFNLPLGEGVEAEQSKEEKEAELRKKAFDAAVNGMYALKPDEIRKMLEIDDETKQAARTPVYPSPLPETAFETISLDPGSKPLTIKTAIGNVTTLSMVDASGQPWPIQDISWAGNFEIQQPEAGSHMLRITPTSEFASGNVSMRMVGLNPPVILLFRADRQKVHVRIDVQVPELGPNGIAPLINTSALSTTAGDGRLSAVLEGVPPSSAKKMTLTGVDERTSAYNMGGMMYLRTPYTLLSPAWNSSVRSADGMNVYSLASTPVVLLSDKGKMVRAYLSGEEQSNGK
jgi:intracellular multiplication protein IcmK